MHRTCKQTYCAHIHLMCTGKCHSRTYEYMSHKYRHSPTYPYMSHVFRAWMNHLTRYAGNPRMLRAHVSRVPPAHTHKCRSSKYTPLALPHICCVWMSHVAQYTGPGGFFWRMCCVCISHVVFVTGDPMVLRAHIERAPAAHTDICHTHFSYEKIVTHHTQGTYTYMSLLSRVWISHVAQYAGLNGVGATCVKCVAGKYKGKISQKLDQSQMHCVNWLWNWLLKCSTKPRPERRRVVRVQTWRHQLLGVISKRIASVMLATRALMVWYTGAYTNINTYRHVCMCEYVYVTYIYTYINTCFYASYMHT